MSRIKALRERLGLTQTRAGEIMGCTQGNVCHYERGQTVPPEAAKRLLAYACEQGVEVTYEDIYGPVEQAASSLHGSAVAGSTSRGMEEQP